jgi:predicted signal transduction protein with EAL and GGDEF domain
VPLAIAIGVAASPADGVDADALTARADEALFAARAAGVPIA